MSIHTLINKKSVNITNIVTKIGGHVIKECPLQIKTHNMVVNFITYGIGTDQMVKAVVNLNSENFSVKDINKLLSDKNLSKVCNGIEINLNPGEYKLNTNLICTIDNVSIKSDGYALLNKNIELKNCKNCEINGLNFKEASIIINKTENCKLLYNVLDGGKGLKLYNSNNIIINSNRSENCQVGMTLDNSSNNIIMDNKCINNKHDGIELVNKSNNNVVMSNLCTKNGEVGIYLLYSNFNIVNTNQYINNKWSGICLHRCKNTSVVSNISTSNGLSDVIDEDSTNSIVSMNRGSLNNQGSSIKTLGNFD